MADTSHPDDPGQESPYKGICLCGKAIQGVLYQRRVTYREEMHNGMSSPRLLEMVVDDLRSPGMAAAVGLSDEQCGEVIGLLQELSGVVPVEMLDVVRSAWMLADANGTSFELVTGEGERPLLEGLTAVGGIQLTMTVSDNGVKVEIDHGLEHAPWYQTGQGVRPPG